MRYSKLNSELVLLKSEYRSMIAEERETIHGKYLMQKIMAKDRDIKDLDKAVGTWTRPTGNYKGFS